MHGGFREPPANEMLYNMTSGDQFRASGASWPSAAHQQTVFYNSKYGAFSLFHDPGNPTGLFPAGGTLYSSGGPLFNVPNLAGTVTDMAQSTPLQRFMENTAVIRPYFAPKLQFGLDVPPILPAVQNPFVDRGLSHLELMTKGLLGSHHPPYSSPEKKVLDEHTRVGNASNGGKSFSDVVYIKSEHSDVGVDGENAVNNRSHRSIQPGIPIHEVGFKDGSRGLRLQNKSEQERRVLEVASSNGETCESKYSLTSDGSSNWNGNEKCNINVIDLSISGSLKSKKKLEKLSVKCESLDEVCTRLSGGKCRATEKTIELTSPGVPGCSRTSTIMAKSQRKHNSEVPSLSIKNEPSFHHKCVSMESPSPFMSTPTPLPLSDIFHPSRLGLLDKCGNMYRSSETEGTTDSGFLNPRLNPCYFPGNHPLASHFPDVNRWPDKTFINPFQFGAMSSSSSTTLLSPSTFDFANPLGMKREVNGPPATTSSAAAVDGRDPGFLCSRPASNNTTDNVDFRLPPVGFEILRDPVTGKYLLIPAASIEALQRALFWPGYQPPALLPISNNEPVKNGVESGIKEEDCSVTVSSSATPRKEKSQTRPHVTRNWLVEKAVKEEMSPVSVDVSGLELLSRGIEKIERESEDKMSGLGLLCALAEQRMKDEIERTEEKVTNTDGEEDDDDGKPKKIMSRRREVSPNVIKRQEMSPPVLEKATDIPPAEEGEEEVGQLKEEAKEDPPPTLTPNTEDVKPVFVKVEFEAKETNDDNNNNKDEEIRLKKEAEEEEEEEEEKEKEKEKEKEQEQEQKQKQQKEEDGEGGEEEEGSKKRKLSLRSAAVKAKRRKSNGRRSPRRSERKKRLEPSDYLFRPIDPDKSWLKREDECPGSRVSERLSSFEIVRPEPEVSPNERNRRTRTRSECKAITSDGEDSGNSTKMNSKSQGKLILKLRREKIRLSETEGGKSCVLTTESLMTDKFPIRILTVDGGLFYTGQLSAIQPPDVYGITIDGERGNRPHIYSREEILNNSILEVRPTSAEDLKPGTRICAYWSGQYRCLYPGSVATSVTPDPEPDSVNIEFDDGDSCRINVNDVRMLPENYPIVEYDPNPLLSLAKKKRRVAVKMEENGEKLSEDPIKTEPTDEDYATKSERKLLKKLKREKKKRLKREHSADGWGQKHHKKHKKHRHKHGKKHKGEASAEETPQDGESGDVGKRWKRKKAKSERVETSTVSSRTGGLLGRRLWVWSGKGFRRAGVKGKARKEYYRAIQRGDERIVIGECAVFLSTGRPDRPFIGRIESMWETWGANMVVRVKWFYHPEETVGCPATLEYPGALFESPHSDENDVQTISHKCEVLPLKRYVEKLGKGARNYEGNTTLFYLAGFYDPTNTTLQFQEGVK